MVGLSCNTTIDNKVISLPAVETGRRQLACQRRQQVDTLFPDQLEARRRPGSLYQASGCTRTDSSLTWTCKHSSSAVE